MTDYDTMLMIFGQLETSCVMPEVFLPWPAIFMADWVRGDLTNAQFIEMMTYAGPLYEALANCVVTVR